MASLTVLLVLIGCASKEPPVFKLIELYQQKKFDEVMTLAEKAIQKDPNDTQAHRFLVRAAHEKGELEKHKQKYQQLIQENPNTAGYHFGLGYVYTHLEDFEAAIAELNKAVELKPDVGYAHYVLGWIHLNTEYDGANVEEGLANWKKEEELDAKSLGALQVYYDRANYHLRVGDGEAAEKDYEKITYYAFAPSDIAFARNAISQIRALRDELARLEAEVERNPSEADPRFKLGVAQYKNGKVKEAIETWHKATELAPDNTEIRNQLGKALIEDGRYAEAAEQLNKVIELDPKMAIAYYNLATAEELLGKNTTAVKYYKKYLELNPMAPRGDEVKQKIATLEAQTAAPQG